MAGSNVIARAWVQIVPEMSGSQKAIAEGIVPAAERAGDKAGKQAGASYGSGLSGKLSGLGSKLSGAVSGGLSGVSRLFSGCGGTSGAGFLSGVSSRLSGLGSRVSGAASGALSSVKSLFSSKGAESGASMGEGISSALSAKAAAVYAVASGIASKVIGAVTASIGSAVSRVDTLSNFPTVLQNLGYGAEESQASVDTLSDRLSSLPTKLDAAASGVQALAPSSKSIDQATNRYLAFNDALLAGAASEDVQQNAMAQLTKAVSTNKMEMDTWMSIQGAMPGQLDQVAKHMLGQQASASDLYQAMKDGKVSVSDFADAMVDLDQNGGDGITSFADQAVSAVGGIGTSFSNMKNAVTKGVANVIKAIGSENIVGFINSVKAGINQAFSGVVSLVGPAKAALSGFASAIGDIDAEFGSFSYLLYDLQDLAAAIGPALATVAGGALAVLPGVLDSVAVAAAPIVELATAAAPILAGMAAQVMQLAADLVAVAAPALAAVFNTITVSLPVVQALWDAVWPALSAVVSTVFGAVSGVVYTVMAAIQGVILAVMAAVQGDWSGAWSIISGTFSSIWGTISSAVGSAMSGLRSAVSSGVDAAYGAVTGIKDKIVGFFSGAGSWLVESGKAILGGLKDGIMSAVGSVTSAVSGAMSQIRAFFPFSPAKRGPFSGRGYTTYSGAALMGGLGEGISGAARSAARAAGDAMAGVRAAFAGDVSVGASVSGIPVGRAQGAPSGILGPLTSAMADVTLSQGETAIYVDGKKLASTIARPMNQCLGVMAARGY